MLISKEHTFPLPALLNPVINEVGSAVLPEFNKLITDQLETFQMNPDFESGRKLYPGKRCRLLQYCHLSIIDVAFNSNAAFTGEESCSWDPHAKVILYNKPL